MATIVVDDLRVDVLERPMDADPRAVGVERDAPTDMPLATQDGASSFDLIFVDDTDDGGGGLIANGTSAVGAAGGEGGGLIGVLPA